MSIEGGTSCKTRRPDISNMIAYRLSSPAPDMSFCHLDYHQTACGME